jgi:Flp pilus assembly protein TadG
MQMLRHTGHGDPNDCGAAAVEFAVVTPLLVMLIVGMVQFGIIYNAYIGVTHAAREGARMDAVGSYTSAEVKARAPQLDPAKVVVIESKTTDYCEVTVRYPYQLNIPFVPSQPPMWLESTARMRRE